MSRKPRQSLLPLTPARREWLRFEVDRRRRIQVRQRAKRDLKLFENDPGRVTA
jgi:hypothetical protein